MPGSVPRGRQGWACGGQGWKGRKKGSALHGLSPFALFLIAASAYLISDSTLFLSTSRGFAGSPWPAGQAASGDAISWSMAPKMLEPSLPLTSMRMVSPNFMKSVLGLPS